MKESRGTCYRFTLKPRIPERLAPLERLANDLYYSWSAEVRSLFEYLDKQVWEQCGHNPKLFLRRVSQKRLEKALQDRTFMENLNRALSDYHTYLQEQAPAIKGAWFEGHDLVAYFSAEFGFHESLPIYSGGLGILAADHCKAASDLQAPLVAVGLLYRQGYFTQTIDEYGNQIPHFVISEFDHLPLSCIRDGQGREVKVAVNYPEGEVQFRLWQAKVGHIRLFLLDSDIPENSPKDRAITYQLYGGDTNMRIRQEIALGIGGVRALRALGIGPNIWHINEGHAAFQVLERCRERIGEGYDFDTALEMEAGRTVFTTHTPVPAGHDIFSQELLAHYFRDFFPGEKVPMAQLLALGSSPAAQGGFNMTALALRGSRYHNGVSRIHGMVASEMEGYVWPQIPFEENPLTYITNGIHVNTFLAREWYALFDMQFGQEWRNQLCEESYWRRIDGIPDYSYWSVRQSLKSNLLEEALRQVKRQLRRKGAGPVQMEKQTRFLNPTNTETLLIGFARRFATYKRATLIFREPERLAQLLSDPERPVLIFFAGKAHPADLPGQQLLRTIYEYSQRPEFEGKVIFLEDYNLALARKLLTGVDVWLNNPLYPMEACGTSGMKAAINGVVNLSILDGWWAEAFDGENGWGIAPHTHIHDPEERDRSEAHVLLDVLEHDVIPLYYARNGHGHSEGWIEKSKASMRSILPHFNARRMFLDYAKRLYLPAARHGEALLEDGKARALAEWKHKVARTWPKVTVRRVDEPVEEVETGEKVSMELAANLHDLLPEDVVAEVLIGMETEEKGFEVKQRHALSARGKNEAGETLFRLDLEPTLPGLQCYKLRLYPYHPLLAHPFETGYMLWV
ncbi:MAG: alpha-glucan family phosphorylase [Gammaproteobacteria bacterium]|nr:MAG: alpha-glucan family phosphorylase [Gammaproteobacteria bacterium]